MDSNMMKKAAITISPDDQDHAQRYLHDCLESLKRQNWVGEKKLFITDNQSTVESELFLPSKKP
jgi:hypothetical protein